MCKKKIRLLLETIITTIILEIKKVTKFLAYLAFLEKNKDQ